MTELKCCPFCGDTEAFVYQCSHDLHFLVGCMKCSTDGPKFQEEKEAIENSAMRDYDGEENEWGHLECYVQFSIDKHIESLAVNEQGFVVRIKKMGS